MKIHKEGRGVLATYFIILLALNTALYYLFKQEILSYIVGIASIVLFLISINFYRSPYRRFQGEMDGLVVSSADGKIVTIEEVYEGEYFKDQRLLISVFMSPFNVHANWFPINGKVLLSKHHPGRFMAAYLPKSSTENERSTIVMETEDGRAQLLIRQVAGAMARRIVTYPKTGDEGHIDEHLGFIKLGSRVDIFLPLGSKVLVEMHQYVTGNQTVLANLAKK